MSVRVNVYSSEEPEYRRVREDDRCCFGTIKKVDGIALAIISCIASFIFLPPERAIPMSALICIVTMISISDNDRGQRPRPVFWGYDPFQPFSWTYRTVISEPYRIINDWFRNQGSYSGPPVDRVGRGEENNYRSRRAGRDYQEPSVPEYDAPFSPMGRTMRGERSALFSSMLTPLSSTSSFLTPTPPTLPSAPPSFRTFRGEETHTSNPSSQQPIEKAKRGGGGDNVQRVQRGEKLW